MTTLRNSQLVAVSVGSNPTAAGLRVSQLATVSISTNPPAAGLRISQLVAVAVIANGQNFQQLGNPVNLGCWTPCGVLAYNGE